jgi:hypothetical protein
MGRSPNCRVCSVVLIAMHITSGTVAEHESISRQIGNGICDACSRLRHLAAVEFERASHDVRMLAAMGAGWLHTRPPRPIPVLARAMGRLQAAEQECVRLRMWPTTERSTT